MSMMKRIAMAGTLVISLAAVAAADVWDVQTTNDNTTATGNELLHGSDQLHDLAVQVTTADKDFYALGQKAYSSWEIVVDGTSADFGNVNGISLNRVGADGSTVLQTSEAITSTIKFSRSLRWENATSNTVSTTEYIRVQSTVCGTTCGTDDIYRIRALETTYAISRFNNVGTQATAVVIQNTASYPVNGRVYFWNATGGSFIPAGLPFSIPAKGLHVLNTDVAPLTEQSGSVTITHSGRYGDLAGKAVSVEPSTGFTFDTPLVPRPY